LEKQSVGEEELIIVPINIEEYWRTVFEHK
jgi:hypothetical protein